MKKFISLCLSMLLILLLNPIASFSKEAVCVYRPKVSVVIPVYKVEPWLRECMDSLVNQTLKDIEIICVDDGSPDSCGAILDEYARKDNRVKAIHQRNQGVQKARNAGLDIARGEYIALVDSDDYVDLRTYETAYNIAKKDDLDILNFGFRRFEDGKDDHKKTIDFSDAPVISLEQFWYRAGKAVWNKLFKSELIQKDKIRFVPGIRPADDTCFSYMALAGAKRIKSIPARFYNYRNRPSSLAKMSTKDIFINSYKMFKYICDSWRNRSLIKGQEHILLNLIFKWNKLCCKGNLREKYAQEILDSVGSDICTAEAIKKCPKYIQREIRSLERAAQRSPTCQEATE